jgi:excisionase family DNA binding protein
MARDGYLSVREAARRLGKTKPGIHYMVKNGTLSAERIREGNREWLEVPIEEIEPLAAESTPPKTPARVPDRTDNAFTLLVEAINENVKESREGLTRVLEGQVSEKDKQLAARDEQIKAYEDRLQRLEGELDEARIPWWQKLFS